VPRCPSCEGAVESRHRFCPWCAAPLRSKLVELFRPHPEIGGDSARALRVSRYLGSDIPHTRISIWDTDRAASAISLDDDETRRLASFLCDANEPDTAVTEPLPTVGRS
jgi:hypothetical protein